MPPRVLWGARMTSLRVIYAWTTAAPPLRIFITSGFFTSNIWTLPAPELAAGTHCSHTTVYITSLPSHMWRRHPPVGAGSGQPAAERQDPELGEKRPSLDAGCTLAPPQTLVGSV